MMFLIISADDYAQSSSIDAGILELIQQRRVTATSCLTLSKRWSTAAKLITGDIRSKADIGLHLDFTKFDQPLRHALPIQIMLALVRNLPRKLIREAINNQLNRFEDALNTPPDYIDGHQHVHQLPQIRYELLDILVKRYSSKLPWIRISNPPLSDGLKATVIGMLGAGNLSRHAIKSGLQCSDSLLGVYGFNVDAEEYLHKLNVWLKIAKESDRACALMCHPALEIQSSNSETEDPISSSRLTEYRVLSSPEFGSLLVEHGLQLTRGNILV